MGKSDLQDSRFTVKSSQLLRRGSGVLRVPLFREVIDMVICTVILLCVLSGRNYTQRGKLVTFFFFPKPHEAVPGSVFQVRCENLLSKSRILKDKDNTAELISTEECPTQCANAWYVGFQESLPQG